jgi:hypothetical protein
VTRHGLQWDRPHRGPGHWPGCRRWCWDGLRNGRRPRGPPRCCERHRMQRRTWPPAFFLGGPRRVSARRTPASAVARTTAVPPAGSGARKSCAGAPERCLGHARVGWPGCAAPLAAFRQGLSGATWLAVAGVARTGATARGPPAAGGRRGMGGGTPPRGPGAAARGVPGRGSLHAA